MIAEVTEKTAALLNDAFTTLAAMSDSKSVAAGEFYAAQANYFLMQALCAELAALRGVLTDKPEGGAE